MYLKGVKLLKETTALNQISRIVDKLNYKSVYIEINTNKDRWVLEKDNSRQIGFKGGVGNKNGKTNKIQ